jgi:hypothetical protein
MRTAALIVAALVIIICSIISSKWRIDNHSVAKNVLVTSDGVALSRDGRGTDAVGTIQNQNAFPVEVTVVAIGRDYSENAVLETKLGPYRIKPGGSRPLQVYLDATPLKWVEFDARHVQKTTGDD